MEQIDKFEHSEEATRPIKNLEAIVDDPAFILSSLDYTNIRGYLLTSIGIINEHQSGVGANMLLKEVSKALY